MKRFRITIEIDAVLDVSQLWPDGDAPENPTAADVRRLVDDCGGVKIIRDWDLDDDAFITVDEVRHPHQALIDKIRAAQGSPQPNAPEWPDETSNNGSEGS